MWTESQVFCLIGKLYSLLNPKTKYELCLLDKHECFKKKLFYLIYGLKYKTFEKKCGFNNKTFFKYHIYIHSIFIQVVGCSQSHGIILSYTHISKCKNQDSLSLFIHCYEYNKANLKAVFT